GSLTGATSTSVNITAAAEGKHTLRQPLVNGVEGCGLPIAVTVRIEDQFGNLTSSTATVILAIGTNPSGGTLSGTTTAAAVSGVAARKSVVKGKGGRRGMRAAAEERVRGADTNTWSIAAGAG